MLTKKQIAANQKRSVRAIIDRIDRLIIGFDDVDQIMAMEAEKFKDAAEAYLSSLDDMDAEDRG